MLIINIIKENQKKRKIFNIKRTKEYEPVRNSIKINGKPFVVVNVEETQLESVYMKKLLLVYEGKVLVSDEYSENEALKNSLYLTTTYYRKALLSSVEAFLDSVNPVERNVSIHTYDFDECKEYYDIAKKCKALTLCGCNGYSARSFAEKCYYEYGLNVRFAEKCRKDTDVFVDLCESRDFCVVSVNGVRRKLLPDSKYFESDESVEQLVSYGISHKVSCAVLRN
jgi:hypothetical protein